ncbi:type VI secretion system protein TssL, long form [Paraburkholderia domus]|uniref:Peptidoglycan-associated lipoprotein n=1 Tax=Paraburkholderia domus TaxID=2793075 RepID=A0A9N8N7J0_9BURK|nr:type VI secretion system protein TssL, long form [Paraburkholderia domus]MBK5050739.1 type VI secretion system protein TssL [Burkholderia sp. R-70006]MBK5059519.1 type VI secretion system protein TssL [Burkholderia sp. R-70199]MBK5119611.1 type VI secretion system protein TssL [Burkholderia sp. R-69980]MBK5167660.1 type VI secretion system protein TssL [Burkholderia sp. R-70211]CAE6758653.1 Peptidoglycan-associated lipoprotein [Paraburkholderia domus]
MSSVAAASAQYTGTPQSSPASASAPGSRLEPPFAPSVAPSSFYASNPLVVAAQPLLDALAQIRLNPKVTPERLRAFLVAEISRFQTRAQQAAVSIETIVGARYCLCTALDEAAALAPWGGSGAWSAHSLLVAFHNETWGGEKFFHLLARLSTQPREHRDLIELQFFCLALGFQGRYRVIQNGAAQLETLMRRLHKLLHETTGGYAQPLSPHWRATDRTPPRALRRGMPLWMWVAGAALLGCASFIAFLLATNAYGDRTYAAVNAIRLPEVTSERALSRGPSLTALLEADVRSGALAVRDEGDRSVIALRGDGLFDSGSAVVNEAALPVLSHIATTLDRVPGDILITGHTDNQPIRDRRFLSNLALSLARAEAVRQWLTSAGLDTRRAVKVAGRGDQQPIDSNMTMAGRARNRRVEIAVYPTLPARQDLAPTADR